MLPSNREVTPENAPLKLARHLGYIYISKLFLNGLRCSSDIVDEVFQLLIHCINHCINQTRG